MAGEPAWEQDALPPMVNIMQVVPAKSQSVRGASHQLSSMDRRLTISHM